MKTMVTAVLAILCIAGFGLAQEGEKKKPAAQNGQPSSAILHVRFADLDADKDGKISKAELESYFAKYDSDQNAGISETEFNAAAASSPGCGAPAKKGGEGGKKRGEGGK
jgi:EF hand domain-containing protein